MSDDLISRKELLDCAEYDQNGRLVIPYRIVENAPAAFDKKKVLAEMRSEYTDATNMYISDKGTAHAFSSEVRKDTWEKAIEIVEKGGIE